MFVFFLEVIVAFFFCKAFMIFLRGGRPAGIFEKKVRRTKERNFLFFLFLSFFLLGGLFPLIKSARLNNRLGSNLQKYALKLSFFGF